MKKISWFNRFYNRLTKPKRNPGGAVYWLPYKSGGVIVTHDNALQLSACFACVRVIAEDLGKIPWNVFVRDANKRVKQLDSRLYSLLNDAPNPETNAMEFRVSMLFNASVWGNGYAEIERDFSNRPMALWIIESWRVTTKRIDGAIWYEVQNDDASKSYIFAADMFHVHGPGFDGIAGMDTVANAALTLGFGIAAEEYGEHFYTNNTTIGTSFKTDNALSDAAYKRLKDEIDKNKGSKKAFEGMILEEGLTPVSVLMKQQDAQYLETRLFQLQEVCRFWRVSPQKIYDFKEAHYDNMESSRTDHVTDTLLPWAIRLEQEANTKLTRYRDKRFTQFDFKSLTRGDLKSRSEYYRTMRNMGAMSADDIREEEGMDPLPEGEGGDLYIVQGQYVRLKDVETAGAMPTGLPIPGDPEDAQNLIKPIVKNILNYFWITDKEAAKSAKSRMDFDNYAKWLQNRFQSPGLLRLRENRILAVMESVELAYGKAFDHNDWLMAYENWAMPILMRFYRDQDQMASITAFSEYFLVCLDENPSKEQKH